MSEEKVNRSDIMNAARIRVILNQGHSFWGVLGLRLEIIPDDSIPTASTNGKQLRYNKRWFESLPPVKQEGTFAHEVDHCAKGHIFRIGNRDLELANIAADHNVNLDMIKAGFSIPEPYYADPRFEGMSFEKIYAILYQEREAQKERESQSRESDLSQDGSKSSQDPCRDQSDQKKGKSPQPDQKPSSGPSDKRTPQKTAQDGSGPKQDENQGDYPSEGSEIESCPKSEGKTEGSGAEKPSDPGNFGSFEKAPESDQEGETPQDLKREWEKAVETTALVCAKAGDLPLGVSTAIKETRQVRPDLEEALSRYLTAKHDYSYSRPDRRLIGEDVYLPGPVKSSLREVIFGIDTSGSTRMLLPFFQEKVNEVLQKENPPERITIIYCDAQIQKVDEVFDGHCEFDPQGGGGTRFAPIFDHIRENDLQADVCIFLTDGENGLEVLEEPPFPTLWVMPIQAQKEPPFGEIVKVDVFA